MKKFVIIFILYFFTLGVATSVFASNTFTTGFIPGSIWYSKSPLVEGDEVKIYTALWNGGDTDLKSRVEFYDGKILLGTRDVVVAKGELKDVSISWRVVAGDHSIYARILSSDVSVNETPKDKLTIKVAIRKVDNTTASSADVVKSEINKATDEINKVVPESLSGSIAESAISIDNFRTDTHSKILEEKDKTQKEIDTFGKVDKDPKDKKLLDSTDKPIAYIKLYLLAVVGFIFSNKLVFYAVSLLLIFLLLRLIYRKIRNR